MVSEDGKIMLSCYFKEYLNIECPGCGMQRAFFYLLEGDLSQSFRSNPACIPLLITFIMLIFQLFFKWRLGGRVIMYMFASTVAVMVINYIIKVIEGRI